MKKIAMLMLATMTAIALTACGGSKTPEASPSTETSAETPTDAATAEETPAPTDAAVADAADTAVDAAGAAEEAAAAASDAAGAADNAAAAAGDAAIAAGDAAVSTELPENFPKELVAGDAKVFSVVSGGEQGDIIVLTSNEEKDKVLADYKEAAGKASIANMTEATQGDNVGFTGTLNDKAIAVAIGPDPTGTSKTLITIILQK